MSARQAADRSEPGPAGGRGWRVTPRLAGGSLGDAIQWAVHPAPPDFRYDRSIT